MGGKVLKRMGSADSSDLGPNPGFATCWHLASLYISFNLPEAHRAIVTIK